MSKVLMGFVGDVHVNRDNPGEIFSKVRKVLAVPHIMFANLEGAYTDDPRLHKSYQFPCAPARNLDVYAEAGFNVMSLANNHIADAGYKAMLETRARLRAQGLKTCGAGESLADAREPAIVEVGGLRVAFLAYASIFPMGYEAGVNSPGLVPLRAYNNWRDPWPGLPAYHAPGMLPVMTTVPDQIDLAYLTDDIRRARERADLVITSFHWGDQIRSYHLTDHETRTARHCIDHGAHMVVGHHHHALRGMEWYQGRPIMYGLGHFVFDSRWEWTEQEVERFFGTDMGSYFKQVHYSGGPRKGWPLLPFPDEFRLNVIAWASAGQDGVTDIGFLPCRLTSDGLVHPLHLKSPESDEVVTYLEKCNTTQGLNGRIESESSRSLAGFQTLRVLPS